MAARVVTYGRKATARTQGSPPSTNVPQLTSTPSDVDLSTLLGCSSVSGGNSGFAESFTDLCSPACAPQSVTPASTVRHGDSSPTSGTCSTPGDTACILSPVELQWQEAQSPGSCVASVDLSIPGLSPLAAEAESLVSSTAVQPTTGTSAAEVPEHCLPLSFPSSSSILAPVMGAHHSESSSVGSGAGGSGVVPGSGSAASRGMRHSALAPAGTLASYFGVAPGLLSNSTPATKRRRTALEQGVQVDSSAVGAGGGGSASNSDRQVPVITTSEGDAAPVSTSFGSSSDDFVSSCSSSGGDGSSGPKRQVQSYLDLGQRIFDNTRCNKCGMLYAPGVPEDEKAHAKHCAAAMRGVVLWPGWPGERVLVRWGLPATGSSTTASALRLIQITPADAAAHGTKTRELDQLLQQELGASRIAGMWSGTSSGSGSGRAIRSGEAEEADSEQQPLVTSADTCQRFVVVADGRVVAALVTERIRSARMIQVDRVSASVSAAAPAAELGSASASASAIASDTVVPQPPIAPADDMVRLSLPTDGPEHRAVLGVSLLWVSPAYRRRGLARALLEAARGHAVYAYPVPKHEMAWSQPTADGYALAKAYFGSPTFLAY